MSTQFNILIPMAGLGSRFSSMGYQDPKPLIEIHGKPMIDSVVRSLGIEGNYIYIVQASHYRDYNLETALNKITPGCTIVQIDGVTEGAAITTLCAKSYINTDTPLIISNSDQIIEWETDKFLKEIAETKVDGAIVVFKASGPKWSYAALGDDGLVSSVAEKKVISDLATVGVYYWSSGTDYVKYAEQMVEKQIRTNNEYYVCPVYNEALLAGKKISTFMVKNCYPVGTPEDLGAYLNA